MSKPWSAAAAAAAAAAADEAAPPPPPPPRQPSVPEPAPPGLRDEWEEKRQNLRMALEEYTQAQGYEKAEYNLQKCSKVFRHLLDNPNNQKLRKMKEDVLIRMVGAEALVFFYEAGYQRVEVSGAEPQEFMIQFMGDIKSLKATDYLVTRASDFAFKLEDLTFADSTARFSKLILEYPPEEFPGVQEVDDSAVFGPMNSTIDRPPKPWEAKAKAGPIGPKANAKAAPFSKAVQRPPKAKTVPFPKAVQRPS